MEKFYCIVLLVTLCGLVTESSCNSLVESRLSGVEREVSMVKDVKGRLEKMESDIESINEAVVKLVFALLENKPKGTEKVHDVKRREVISDNSLTNLPYGDLSDLIGKHGPAGPVGPAGPPGAPGVDGKFSQGGGTVYTRWGTEKCGNNSILLYAGYTGGSNYNHIGGGTNLQCMPMDPKYNKVYDGTGTFHGSYMAGVEYQTYNYGIFPSTAMNQNVPCARCYTNSRSALMMMPAKRDCSEGWTKEYEGYLMAAWYNDNHQTTFECLDENPEYVRGEHGDDDGGWLYFVRTDCKRGGHCPPYDGNKEMTCVVCSK